MRRVVIAVFVLLGTSSVSAQVDQARTAAYFKEVEVLCERDGGKLWGVSLCGPLVIADAATRTIATNTPVPTQARPATLGFANAIVDWGGLKWSTVMWQMVPQDERLRGVLLIHELFHRVQQGLGFFLNEPDNSHLDSVDGRYWLQLEWRALAKALSSSGKERVTALADASAFRGARHKAFPAAAENERILLVNEGLAQFTGTVIVATTDAEAVTMAIEQLERAPLTETFVRTFAYPSGAAYGILLRAMSPDWPRTFKATDDLAALTTAAANAQPSEDAETLARRYRGSELLAAEKKRPADRAALIADLRKRFVDGPVLILPRARTATFVTSGMVPIEGAGTIYPTYRASVEWGTLEAARVLMSTDRSTIAVPAPATATGTDLAGDGWTLKLAAGWVVRPGPRPGDLVVVRDDKK